MSLHPFRNFVRRPALTMSSFFPMKWEAGGGGKEEEEGKGEVSSSDDMLTLLDSRLSDWNNKKVQK